MKLRQHRKTVQRRMHKAVRLQELFLRRWMKHMRNSTYGKFGSASPPWWTRQNSFFGFVIEKSTDTNNI